MRPVDPIAVGPPPAPPAVARGEPPGPAPAADPPRVPDAGFDLALVTDRAARVMFAGREVQVSTYHDQEAGRVVVRIVDRDSGETLAQLPPDELLRFYASAAEDLRLPLVSFAA